VYYSLLREAERPLRRVLPLFLREAERPLRRVLPLLLREDGGLCAESSLLF